MYSLLARVVLALHSPCPAAPIPAFITQAMSFLAWASLLRALDLRAHVDAAISRTPSEAALDAPPPAPGAQGGGAAYVIEQQLQAKRAMASDTGGETARFLRGHERGRDDDEPELHSGLDEAFRNVEKLEANLKKSPMKKKGHK